MQQTSRPRDGNVEQISVAAQEAQGARRYPVGHDRGEEHHVAFVSLEAVHRVDEQFHLFAQPGKLRVLADMSLNELRLCAKRRYHTNAPTVSAPDQQIFQSNDDR